MSLGGTHVRGERLYALVDPVSRTKQSFKNECDINNIMRKFQKTGAVAHVARFGGDYGFATSVDFHEASNIVIRGRELYSALPSSIRKRFGDPGEFLDFVQDPKNEDEMRSLGILPKKASVVSADSAEVKAAKAVTAPGTTEEAPKPG